MNRPQFPALAQKLAGKTYLASKLIPKRSIVVPVLNHGDYGIATALPQTCSFCNPWCPIGLSQGPSTMPSVRSDVFGPAPAQKGVKGFVVDFLRGGVSASVSKTVAAPIERIKLLTKEVRKHSSRKDYRFEFIKGGSTLTNSQGPLVGGRGRKGGGEGVSIKPLVVTTEGPQELSLESSFGQVSGDLEQNSEDAQSGDAFPRGTYQSPEVVAAGPHGIASPHAHTVAISEVEVGRMAELEDALGFPLSVAPQRPTPKPLVIVISGPSGVGKDSVIKKLQHARGDIHFVVTATTRPMRPGEVDGVDYYFMSKTEFQEMIENHDLLEHAIVYGDYKGIPKQQVREFMSQGKDVVLRVDVQGAATVRAILGSEAIFIFLVAESEMALVKRLMERKTETMDKMLVRVATAREELTRMEEFDYVVVNQEGCLDRTVSLICSIIDAEKARVMPKSAVI